MLEVDFLGLELIGRYVTDDKTLEVIGRHVTDDMTCDLSYNLIQRVKFRCFCLE